MIQKYADREAAGAALAAALARFRDADPLILGIPRGGVPVAIAVARELSADVDIVVARKLGAPGQPELAIGAVTANGGRFLNQDVIRQLRVTDAYLESVTERKRAEAGAREHQLRASQPAVPLEGRTVVIVDDGLATGATMRAAVRSVRNGRPHRVIVAVPVGAPESCDLLRGEVDELVTLQEPEHFWAVGAYYRDFEPVSDEDVRRMLQAARRPALAAPSGES